MRTNTRTMIALLAVLQLTACPIFRPKDGDGGKDDAARESKGTDTGETGEEPKPQVETEPPSK